MRKQIIFTEFFLVNVHNYYMKLNIMFNGMNQDTNLTTH